MTNIKVRLGATLAAATLLVGMATACSSETGASDEPVEITMLVNVTPNLTEEYWNDLVGLFEEENPNIDVKIQAPVAASVVESLKVMLATGDAPDVVEHQPPNPDVQEVLLDLSDYEFVHDTPLADLYTLDGNYYMAASGQQYYALMFYNKTAFAEAGITETPTTVDELEEAFEKLQGAGWIPVQTGGEWMTQLAFQAVGIPTVFEENPNWYEDMRSGDATWSETYGEMADRYAEWVQKGYIPNESVSTKYANAEAQFLAGNAAIYPMGNWFAAAVRAAGDNAPDIGVFAAPSRRARRRR